MINYYDPEDVRETASGELIIGRTMETKAPVYFNPTTGMTHFGCGIVPITTEAIDDE